MFPELRQALRQLRKSPGFTATAVITLGLGIGATTAIFTLVQQVMLKSLPVTKPGELWRIGKSIHCCGWGGYTQDEDFSIFSYDLYQHFRDNTPELPIWRRCRAGTLDWAYGRRAVSSRPIQGMGNLSRGTFSERLGWEPGLAGCWSLPMIRRALRRLR